jgi:hypothetical protein
MAAVETLPSSSPPRVAHVINFDKTVVPVSNIKLGHENVHLALKRKPGTGFCLDEICRFVVTNYHVASFVMPLDISRTRRPMIPSP